MTDQPNEGTSSARPEVPKAPASSRPRRPLWKIPNASVPLDGTADVLGADAPFRMLATLADQAEATEVQDGEKVLSRAYDVLADPEAGEQALRTALTSTMRALSSILLVATCRGERLGFPAELGDVDAGGGDAAPDPGSLTSEGDGRLERCARCRNLTEQPVPIAMIEAISGPGWTHYGCPRCAWRIFLDHMEGCKLCGHAVASAGRCEYGRNLYNDIKRARETVKSDGQG